MNAPFLRVRTERRFLLLFACLLVIGAGNSMLTAILPPLVRRLGLPDSSIGWIFSLSALLWVLTSPYWGRLSNRTGRKPIIAAGLAAYSLSMGSFAGVVVLGLDHWIGGAVLFAALILTRAIFGAFGSASSPAAQAYVADRTTPAQRTEQLAQLTAAFALGQTAGPAFTAAAAARTGLVAPLWGVAVLAIAASLAILRFLPEHERPQAIPRQEGALESLAFARDPRIAGYLIFGFALSTVTGTLQQIFSLFVMDRLHVAGPQAAQLAALGFMVAALTLLVTQMAILPRLRLDARALMAWGAGLVAAGVLMQIWAPDLPALLVSQVVQGLGFGLARPGFTGGVSLAVRAEEQGASAGLVVAANGAGFVLSPIFGGVAYQYAGPTAPLFITLVLLAGMAAFVLLSRRLRQRVLEPSTAIGEP